MNKFRIVSAAIFLAALALLGVYLIRSGKGQKSESPTITMDKDLIEVSVADGEEALLQGVTATDTEDGDLTDSLIVESIGRFTEEEHRRVTYAVIDSDGLVSHAERELVYTDYTPTQFSIDSPLAFGKGTTDLTVSVYAEDCLDGDVTSSVKLVAKDEIDTTKSGFYSAELKVVNSAGAASVLPVTIEMYDPYTRSGMPEIKLVDYVAYVSQGTKFDPYAYLESVNIRGASYTFTKDEGTYGAADPAKAGQGNTINYKYVNVENGVDPNVAGNYEVKYSLSEEGGFTGAATLYVVVTEGGTQ